MEVKTLCLGDYQTNCYLVWAAGSGTCAVIDPGCDAPGILAAVRELGLQVEAVFLTHGHFDHVGAVEEIVKATGCRLWMRESDWTMEETPALRWLFPLANCRFCEVCFYEHGETVSAAGLSFTVWETPGHTWGSVCIAAEDALFTGDTLFAGSIGRTDFPHSSPCAMRDSLAFLAEQTKPYTVYPGHGESTTLLREREHNPYWKGLV